MLIESVVHKRVLRSGRSQNENINFEKKNYGIASTLGNVDTTVFYNIGPVNV